jgi:group II intron maturase
MRQLKFNTAPPRLAVGMFAASVRERTRKWARLVPLIFAWFKVFNKAKSAVAVPREREVPGLQLHDLTIDQAPPGAPDGGRFIARVLGMTSRSRGRSLTPSVLRELDQWMRRRLRALVWKQWKRGRSALPNCDAAASPGSGGDNRRQPTWPLAAQQYPPNPVYDPYTGWWEGRGRKAPPIPIKRTGTRFGHRTVCARISRGSWRSRGSRNVRRQSHGHSEAAETSIRGSECCIALL